MTGDKCVTKPLQNSDARNPNFLERRTPASRERGAREASDAATEHLWAADIATPADEWCDVESAAWRFGCWDRSRKREMVARNEIGRVDRVEPSGLTEPNEVVVASDDNGAPVLRLNPPQACRRGMAGEGSHSTNDRRVRDRVKGGDDKAIVIGRSKRDIRAVVIAEYPSARQLRIHEGANRLDRPPDFAVSILAANHDLLIRRQALPCSGRPEERLVPEALGEAVGELVDGLRLVAGRLEIGDELEVGHVPSLALGG